MMGHSPKLHNSPFRTPVPSRITLSGSGSQFPVICAATLPTVTWHGTQFKVGNSSAAHAATFTSSHAAQEESKC